jgi:hypothetical protein
MATLADLVKRQRRTGASASGALLTAVGQKTLAAIDPRKMFNQTGLLTALFPSLKAYKPDGQKSRVDSASKELSGSTTPLLEQMVMKLDAVDLTMRLVAKNTMTMPAMSRDMNIMRQNVVKLVKLQGGKASTKADGFFLRAFERERATEAELQAAKERRVTGKASAVTTIKEKASSIPGLGMLTGLATAIYAVGKNLVSGISSLAEILGPLLKSGLSLLLDFGKGAANLAIKGGGTLFDLAKKIPFSKIIRGLLSFISGAGGMALLSVGSAAAALAYLLTHEKTEYGGDGSDTLGSEMGLPPPPESTPIPKAPMSDELQQRIASRENMRKSDDPAVRAAAESLDKTDPLPKPSSTSTSTSPTPASSASSTSPKLVPSLPSAELGGVNYSSYAQTVGERESNGNYKAVNSLGYLGKYQFGAMALEDMGLVKKGVGAKGQKALDDPSNWTIDGGKEAFLNNPSLQEQTMLRYTKMNFERLKKLGVINDSTTAEKIAGFLASAHLVGPGGAAAMSRGEMRKDAYGTSAESYFKLGSASQNNIGPVPSSSGSQIALASSTVSDARQQMSTQPVVINAPTTNVQQQSKSQNQQPQPNLPNTIDEDLFKALLDRTTGYA